MQLTKKTDPATRQRILEAALARFASSGYTAASIQQIVDEAQVTKPTLYYYFKSKAGLYQALVDWGQDERFRLMQEAAALKTNLADQLSEIMASLFEFLHRNRELARISFSTAFAPPEEIPAEIDFKSKSGRNFEFIHALISKGVQDGTLHSSFKSYDLTMALYGLMSIY